MENKPKIAQYRERLDKTLASPELTNEEMLRVLIKNQLLHSSLEGDEGCGDNIVERKTTEVSNFLGMLRSASVTDNDVSKTSEASLNQWKLKQDTEDYRVMYREGPHGTPYHSLLVEGYIEAPVDVCLCVSWESALYRKWWPQYVFPQFKLTTCNCLKKVRIGEQISIVRLKVPWPMSTREVLVHYFMFDYFQDGLAVVLLNSISDLESIDKSTHGFTSDEIPEPKDAVRLDVVGGFALQKVTQDRSYFRTIANMDIKLDLVPPSLINFIARQLVGNGFKLYQKAVASVCSYNEDYSKALEEALYVRIREALSSRNESEEPVEAKELKNDALDSTNESEKPTEAEEFNKDARLLPEEHIVEGMKDGLNEREQKVHNINHDDDPLENNVQHTDRTVGEIEEESEESRYLDKDDEGINQSLTVEVPKRRYCVSVQNDIHISGINIAGEIEEEQQEETKESKCSDESDKDTDEYLNDEVPEMSYMKTFPVSPRVKLALETLDKAIFIVREYGFNSPSNSLCDLTTPRTTKVKMDTIKDSTSSEKGDHPDVEVSKKEISENNLQESRKSTGIQDSRRSGSNSYLRDVNHNRVAPASLEDYLSNPNEADHVAVKSTQIKTIEIPILEQTMHVTKQKNAEANSIHGDTTLDGRRKLRRKRKQLLCCFSSSLA